MTASKFQLQNRNKERLSHIATAPTKKNRTVEGAEHLATWMRRQPGEF
jgi:hypothetical protein